VVAPNDAACAVIDADAVTAVDVDVIAGSIELKFGTSAAIDSNDDDDNDDDDGAIDVVFVDVIDTPCARISSTLCVRGAASTDDAADDDDADAADTDDCCSSL
jgi:hypothetical protein